MKAKRLYYVYLTGRFALFFVSCAILLALACAAEKPAYGYVDQGSGLLAMQLIGSGFAAILFRFRRRFSSWFGRNKQQSEKEHSPAELSGHHHGNS